MTTLKLTAWQRRCLERQLLATHDVRVYRRTLAVLEVAQGQSVASVARCLRVTPRVVYFWVRAYSQGHDPDALRDAHRCGRPHLLSQEDRDHLFEFLQHAPQDFDNDATAWTVDLLQEHLYRCTGKYLSQDTLRRELHQLDYVWKRPRYVLDPDPELREKKETYPSADQAVAPTQHGAGRRRDRSAFIPATARRLVTQRAISACGLMWSQRETNRLWGLEPPHGLAAVPAARASAGG
jgi:transposase